MTNKNITTDKIDELYFRIGRYPTDTWAQSPEYKELIRRLKTMSVKQLKEQKCNIPLWKLNGVKCPF